LIEQSDLKKSEANPSSDCTYDTGCDAVSNELKTLARARMEDRCERNRSSLVNNVGVIISMPLSFTKHGGQLQDENVRANY
jgi:hypothetical protein